MRNALSFAGQTRNRPVSAAVGTAFAQNDAAAARKQWRDVADQMHLRQPKVVDPTRRSPDRRPRLNGLLRLPPLKIHSIKQLERLCGDIKRYADFV